MSVLSDKELLEIWHSNQCTSDDLPLLRAVADAAIAANSSVHSMLVNVAYEKMQEALMYCKGVIREMQFGGSAELSSEAIKRAEDALLNAEALQTQNKYDLEKELIGYKAAYEEECRKVEYWRSLLLKTERHLNKDCWYWQHDGQDKLSSMADSLPIVISASELRELIAAGVHHES